ncbi:YhdP family protein [uncultured Neptuniibacter sp.]|uniref:YhdP family protein n=1 Tax=uncultured Neptuniibacter sp. TaxID=502143 RepID=UPI002615692A|nr:YhdP family protein [uncultured Neptuniibacter sp.]
MKRHAHSFFWFLYWGLAVVGAILAALLLVIKFTIQDLEQHRGRIETFLSEQLSANVHLAGIRSEWEGWAPVVEIRGLAIDAVEGRPELSLALMQGEVALDPIASARMLSPVFSRLDLDGLTLRYSLLSGGDSAEKNRSDKQAKHQVSSAGSGLLAFILKQSSINFDNAQLVVEGSGGEEVSLSPIHLSLEHDGLLHQLKANAELKTSTGQAEIAFVAEVEGDPSKEKTDFYLKVQGLDQQIVSPWLALADIELESIKAEQEVWGQSHRGKLIYMTGRTAVSDFKYKAYQFDQFTLQTSLIRRNEGYQLQFNDLMLDAEHSALNLPKISLDLKREGYKIVPQKLMVDSLELEKVAAWIGKQGVISAEVQSVLKTLSPEGRVENLLVTWGGSELNDFHILADLNTVGINAWDDVPELKGINGLLKADMKGGQIHLNSQKFSMHYPTLFDYQWQYQGAEGVIGWRFEEEGVVVASQLLNLSNEHLSASGRFSIYLPFSQNEQPLLNLQIGMQQSDGLQAKYYIPPKEVGVKTYQWLVDAIKQGRIKRAGFILNGVTRSRLDDYQLPAVQMFFDVSDATFEYQPGWPAIEHAETFVFFRNGELVAEAEGGQIFDSTIQNAWVHLPQAMDKLLIAGSVEGGAQDIESFLLKSPLKQEVGDDLAAWEMAGRANTTVDINLPLKGGELPMVDVQTVLKDGRFHSPSERIDFTQMNGKIRYRSDHGLESDKITARLFAQPVSAAISTKRKKTQILIDGAIEADLLREWLALDLLKVAKGKIHYNAQLQMCPGKVCNQLVVKSTLRGVELSAPAPLAKTASQTRSLTIMSDLGRNGRGQTEVRLNLANQLRGIMINRGDALEAARFTLGGDRPDRPTEPGIILDGMIPALNYADLEQFLSAAGFNDSVGSPQRSKDQDADSLLREVNLSIGRFDFNDIALSDLNVRLKPQPEGWMLNLTSPEVAGKLWLPESASKPYKAALKYLVITDGDETSDTEEPFITADIKPESLPMLDLQVDDLRLYSKQMGEWAFNLRPTENGASINDIRGKIESADVRGELRWEKTDQEVSDLTIKLDSEDFGKVLSLWGFEESLETKSLHSYLQLSWGGAPWEFELANADGELQFTAGKGRLLDVGNSGNFLRVFGILNLQSLGRRLRLDFSDLFKSGVAFDEMKANYKIQKGIATTAEPFIMTGPSANLAMQGSLDLVRETVDKDIEVALPVTGNIPLVSVLLGAPQVAGAVFLFDKLIGDPLEKFTTVKYHMSGDWSDPEVDLKNHNQSLQ